MRSLSQALCLSLLIAITSVSAEYSQSTAIEYVWMSAAAYCSSQSIQSWNCGKPCEQIPMSGITVAYDSKLNVQAYVGRRQDSGDVVVSFRGTEPKSLKDWIDDFKYAKMSPFNETCSGGCKVHSGFYDSYHSLRSQILSGFRQLEVTTSTAVHITGHSLGAAMATVAAYDLKITGYNVVQGFTFGDPRVGNKAFSQAFSRTLGQSTVYRVTHWRDPVPHLPLELMDFYHVPTEVWYNSDSSSFQVCDGSGEDGQCSDSLDFDTSISDHLHYINIPISGSCDSDKFSFNDPEDFEVLGAAAAEQLKKLNNRKF
eukprot:gb/GECG01003149.1/.p1 GENE.gb/GECG01003149.1/~~gb/GECG01003149.1/.p1  ORF type:complete len:313 (+),score=31.07 gb/GECG01003149.1/:1-939(+)